MSVELPVVSRPSGSTKVADYELRSNRTMSTLTTVPTQNRSRRRLRRVAASESDHESVLQLLRHVFHSPSRDAFNEALADPFYRPEDRLLVKAAGRVVSHVHRTRRIARFGKAQFSMGGLMWVATHPDFGGRDLTRDLVRDAENRAREEKTPLLVLTTSMPLYYRRLGWTILGRHCFSEAPARNLPRCSPGPARNTDEKESFVPVIAQPWRQDQIDPLRSLYEQAYGNTTGTIVRNERYWQWLISRGYAKDIWLAQQGERPVGYAFVRGERILEIAHCPSNPGALVSLLARIRIEALDRGQDKCRVYAPADHPVHSYFRRAGGQMTYSKSKQQMVFMAKVTDFEQLLRAILPELEHRVAACGLPEPVEIGLIIGQLRCLLHFGQQPASLEFGKTGRKYLKATAVAATHLIFGHDGLEWLIDQKQVQPSNAAALELAEALFPPTHFWRSPLDAATG